MMMAAAGKKRKRRTVRKGTTPPAPPASPAAAIPPKSPAAADSGDAGAGGGVGELGDVLEGDRGVEALFTDDWSDMPANTGMAKSNVSSAQAYFESTSTCARSHLLLLYTAVTDVPYP